MKVKYYLRGLGTGILFATIVLFISYSYRMSDSKIKEKAEELGMVYADNKETSKDSIIDSSVLNDDEEKEDTSEEKQSTADVVSESNPDTSASGVVETTTEQATTIQDTELKSCQFTVTNYTVSDHVAIALFEAGVITDADDFNNYLINSGYAYRIQNGTYTFTNKMTYQEMAELITSRQY